MLSKFYFSTKKIVIKHQRCYFVIMQGDLQIPSSPYFPAYAQGQGPPPMVQERFQSVITQLFQYVQIYFGCEFGFTRLSFLSYYFLVSVVSLIVKRIIRCGGAVDDDMANIILAQLLYLDAVDPEKVCLVLCLPSLWFSLTK